MKTNILNKTTNVFAIACIIFLSATVNQVNAQELKSKYYYDHKDMPLAPSRTICKTDESGKNLELYAKYFFTYDDEGRVTEKVMHHWNKYSKSWKPVSIWQIKYGITNITVDYAAWNKKEKTYTLNKEKAIYQLNEGKVASYMNLKQNSKNDEWIVMKNNSKSGINLPESIEEYLLTEHP